MKRVLHIMQTLRGGGAETAVRLLCPRLHARGFAVGAAAIYRVNLTTDEAAELHADLFEIDKRNRADAMAFVRLMRVVRGFRPDIIHSHTYAGKYWGRAAAVLCKIPVILTEHGAAFKISPLERAISSALDRRTAAVVAFSAATAQAVSNNTRTSEVRVIPNGVPLDLRYNRSHARTLLKCRPEELVVVTVGRLSPEKGPATAIHALSRLPNSLLKHTRLHWIGDGPLRADTEKLAIKLNLENNIIFHGYRSDASFVLAGADVALSPSSIEAAPMWLLEAMAAGVPIVGTPTLGVRDLVENPRTGLISASHDSADLGSTLASALSNDEWRETARVAAKTRAQRFDIEAVADAYASLYREVLALSA